jgi:hypothetical protein
MPIHAMELTRAKIIASFQDHHILLDTPKDTIIEVLVCE